MCHFVKDPEPVLQLFACGEVTCLLVFRIRCHHTYKFAWLQFFFFFSGGEGQRPVFLQNQLKILLN